MPTLEETLKRLAVSFTARDIMIPVSDLVSADDESEALAVFQGFLEEIFLRAEKSEKGTFRYVSGGRDLFRRRPIIAVVRERLERNLDNASGDF